MAPDSSKATRPYSVDPPGSKWFKANRHHLPENKWVAVCEEGFLAEADAVDVLYQKVPAEYRNDPKVRYSIHFNGPIRMK